MIEKKPKNRSEAMKRSLIVVILIIAAAGAYAAGRASGAKTLDLLPKLEGWSFSEDPVLYGPESLFEYINGAAEAFIGYDLIDAAVGQYKQPTGTASLTAEVYDMGKPLNAFGIYATERYPESRFLPLGVQGYIEEGTLNFLAGRYYVKLMAYEAGDKTESVLQAAAADILRRIGDPGGFPALLGAFPAEGRLANTEKYILKSFLGLEFLKNGLLAAYKGGAGDYEAFIIDTASEAEAEAMLARYLEKAAAGAAVGKSGRASTFKDRYLENVTVGRTGRFLYGTTKVKDADKAAGEKTAAGLQAGLAGR
jgi:hypothetical protein